MDPMTLFAVASAGSSVAGGLAGASEGMTEAARLDSEAKLADTQALQRDTSLRDELSRFLSSTRSARSANGLSATSPNAIRLMTEATKVSSQERLVQTGNDKQRAANFRAGAKSARRGARMSLVTGFTKAAVPITQRFI